MVPFEQLIRGAPNLYVRKFGHAHRYLRLCVLDVVQILIGGFGSGRREVTLLPV